MNPARDNPTNAATIDAGLRRVAVLCGPAGRDQLRAALVPARSIAEHARFVRDVIDLLTGTDLATHETAARNAA